MGAVWVQVRSAAFGMQPFGATVEPARHNTLEVRGVATVLIGEDTADLAALLTILVGRAGHTVRVERDGSATLAVSRLVCPDLLILDVQLPGLSGLDVCRAVRADPRLRALPVLMVSARGMYSEVAEGMAAGADSYLVKPFTNAELVGNVTILLRDRSRSP